MPTDAGRSGRDRPGISGDGGGGAQGVVDLSLARFLATQTRAPEDLAQALGFARRGDRTAPAGGSGVYPKFSTTWQSGPTAVTNCQPGSCAAMMG